MQSIKKRILNDVVGDAFALFDNINPSFNWEIYFLEAPDFLLNETSGLGGIYVNAEAKN